MRRRISPAALLFGGFSTSLLPVREVWNRVLYNCGETFVHVLLHRILEFGLTDLVPAQETNVKLLQFAVQMCSFEARALGNTTHVVLFLA